MGQYMDATADGQDFDLVNLTGSCLADLRKLDRSVFAESLRRILDEIDRPQDAVAGWQSRI